MMSVESYRKGSFQIQSPETGSPNDLVERLSKVLVKFQGGGHQQPGICNYSNVTVTPGTVFIDFGFIEPEALGALHRAATERAALPEAVDVMRVGRLAFGIDAASALHQQLNELMNELGLKQKE
jgi:hypothetical protein